MFEVWEEKKNHMAEIEYKSNEGKKSHTFNSTRIDATTVNKRVRERDRDWTKKMDTNTDAHTNTNAAHGDIFT